MSKTTSLTRTDRNDGLALRILVAMESGGYEEMRMKRSEQMRREGRVRVQGGGGRLKKRKHVLPLMLAFAFTPREKPLMKKFNNL